MQNRAHSANLAQSDPWFSKVRGGKPRTVGKSPLLAAPYGVEVSGFVTDSSGDVYEVSGKITQTYRDPHVTGVFTGNRKERRAQMAEFRRSGRSA